MKTEIKIGRKTRQFEVTEMDMTGNVLLTADLIARGFDGKCYLLTGDRGGRQDGLSINCDRQV